MLVELAVGDSFGAAFEYSPKSFIEKHNTGIYFSKHPRHNIPPGFYTDDTQMTLAIAEQIVSNDTWNPINLAKRFVEVFHRDPRTGYAGGFYKFLQSVKTGKEFLERIKTKSDKSGAAMRVTPVGLYSDIQEVLDKAELQAKITHDTPGGMASAQAAALLVHYCRFNLGPLTEAGEWIQSEIGGAWHLPWEKKVKTKGYMSVRAAITALQRNTSLIELLKDCINFTGDVDTVATIALAAASTSISYERDIPDSLTLALENRKYGRDYLVKLDLELWGYFNERYRKSKERLSLQRNN